MLNNRLQHAHDVASVIIDGLVARLLYQALHEGLHRLADDDGEDEFGVLAVLYWEVMLGEVDDLVVDVVEVEVGFRLAIPVTGEDLELVQLGTPVDQPHPHEALHEARLLYHQVY